MRKHLHNFKYGADFSPPLGYFLDDGILEDNLPSSIVLCKRQLKISLFLVPFEFSLAGWFQQSGYQFSTLEKRIAL